MTRLFRDQSGVALVVVAGILLVIGITSAVVASAAISLRESSTESRNAKRALAAAEAGVRHALYQLNQIVPDPNQCVGTGAAANPTVGIFCKGHAYLGNGASYDFYVSQVLDGSTPDRVKESNTDGLGCVGRDQSIATSSTTTLALDQRCIVAVGCVRTAAGDAGDCVDDSAGTVRGTSRRVSVRTGAQTRLQFFPGGLYGNDVLCVGADWVYNQADVDDKCNASGGGSQPVVDSDIGSNKFIHLTGGGNPIPVCDTQDTPTRAAQILLGNPGGKFSDDTDLNDNACDRAPATGLVPQHVPVPGFGDAPDVDPLFRGCWTNPGCSGAQPGTDTARTATNVVDQANFVANVLPACAVYSGDRELDLRGCPNTQVLELPPGNYNFCRLWSGDTSVVPNGDASAPPDALDAFVGGAPVRIWIDSPYREGSGCGKGNTLTGTLTTGISDTYGRNGDSWDYSGSVPANCSGQVNNPSAYRCADGSFTFANKVNVTGGGVNESLKFQLWIYGNRNKTFSNGTCRPFTAQAIITPTGAGSVYDLPCPPQEHPIDFNNNANLTFSMFAPESTIVIRNSGNNSAITVNGAIRARNIAIKNGLVFTQDIGTRKTSLALVRRRYFRGPWIECTPRPSSGTEPRAGC